MRPLASSKDSQLTKKVIITQFIGLFAVLLNSSLVNYDEFIIIPKLSRFKLLEINQNYYSNLCLEIYHQKLGFSLSLSAPNSNFLIKRKQPNLNENPSHHLRVCLCQQLRRALWSGHLIGEIKCLNISLKLSGFSGCSRSYLSRNRWTKSSSFIYCSDYCSKMVSVSS